MASGEGLLTLSSFPLNRRHSSCFLNSGSFVILSIALGAVSSYCVASVEGSLVGTPVVTIVLLGLGCFILHLEGRQYGVAQSVVRQFIVTFGLRLCVTSIFHTWLRAIYPMPLWYMDSLPDGGDEFYFYDTSKHWADAFLSGKILSETPGLLEADKYWAFNIMIGFVRFVGSLFHGDTLFNAKIFSCFLSALVVGYVYLLALRLFDARTAKSAAILAFFLPDYWYLGSSILRDVCISCAVVVVVYQSVCALQGGFNWVRLVYAALLDGFVLRHLKSWAAEGMAALVCLWWYINEVRRRLDPILAWIATSALAIMIAVMLSTSFLDRLTDYGLGEPIGLQRRLEAQRTTGLDEGGAGSIGAAVLAMPLYIRVPANFVQLMVGIPAWGGVNRWGLSPRTMVETICGLVWLGFCIYIPAGLLNCITAPAKGTVWVWGSAVVMAISLAAASTITMRWRMIVMPLLLILVACGMRARNYRWTIGSTAVSIVILYAFYIALKV